MNWYRDAVRINPLWAGGDEGTDRKPIVFCSPKIVQNIRGFLSRESGITNEKKDEIINEISGYISTNLNEMGNKESMHSGEILASNEVKNKFTHTI